MSIEFIEAYLWGVGKNVFVSGIIKLVVGRMWNILSISAGDLRNYTYLIHEFCMQLMDTKLVTWAYQIAISS